MEVKHERFYKGKDVDYSEFKDKGMPVDTPPRGDKFNVDWKAVYNIEKKLKLEMVQNQGLKNVLTDFNTNYRNLLEKLNEAVNKDDKTKQNEYLQKSIMHMHQMHHQAEAIMKIPLDSGFNAAPTWEI